MTFLCIGKSVLKEAKIVSYIDLVLAILGIIFGLLALAFPESLFLQWDIFSYRFISQRESGYSDVFTAVSTMYLLSIFLLEIFLFILFTSAIKQLNEKKLYLWYKTRFTFFILSVLISVYRTIEMKSGPYDIVILKGIGSISLLLYRGYGLLVVTFLEEIVLKDGGENIPRFQTDYFKL